MFGWSCRASHLRERMEDPHCDKAALFATYSAFARVNRLVAGWRRVYRAYLLPQLQPGRTTRLLDIGAGAADVAAALCCWARRDGRDLKATAIDPDPRVAEYLRSHPLPSEIDYQAATAGDLVATGERYDLVISNHLLHHLFDEEVAQLCHDSASLACRLVVHNDIERSALAYAAFHVTRPFFRGSFITEDGLTSIRRSHSASELARLAPAGWYVRRMAPFRNLLCYDAARHQL